MQTKGANQPAHLHSLIRAFVQSGKPSKIPESNQASGVRKSHYASYYVRKSSILLAGTCLRKISSVACGFSPIEIHFSDYRISLISSINEVYVFFNKILCYSHILLKKNT